LGEGVRAWPYYVDVGGELPCAFVVGRRFPLHQVFGHLVAVFIRLHSLVENPVDLHEVGVERLVFIIHQRRISVVASELGLAEPLGQDVRLQQPFDMQE
jgi:hypothetical protein